MNPWIFPVLFTFPVIHSSADLPPFQLLPKPPLPFPPLTEIQPPFRTWLFLWPLCLETTHCPTSQGWVCGCLHPPLYAHWWGIMFFHILWLPNTNFKPWIIILFFKAHTTPYLPTLFSSTCQQVPNMIPGENYSVPILLKSQELSTFKYKTNPRLQSSLNGNKCPFYFISETHSQRCSLDLTGNWNCSTLEILNWSLLLSTISLSIWLF